MLFSWNKDIIIIIIITYKENHAYKDVDAYKDI